MPVKSVAVKMRAMHCSRYLSQATLTNLVLVVSHLAVAVVGMGNSSLASVPSRMDTTATGPMAISLDTPRAA